MLPEIPQNPSRVSEPSCSRSLLGTPKTTGADMLSETLRNPKEPADRCALGERWKSPQIREPATCRRSLETPKSETGIATVHESKVTIHVRLRACGQGFPLGDPDPKKHSLIGTLRDPWKPKGPLIDSSLRFLPPKTTGRSHALPKSVRPRRELGFDLRG